MLYLVQHGEAKTEEEDPDRPLTEAGRRAVEAVATLLGDGPAVAARRVVHSGKARARETAEILVSRLSLTARLEEDEALSPMAEPALWADRLARAGSPDTLLVGHLPHLSRLAGLLLVGDADADPVVIRNGGVLCLERAGEAARWCVRWYVTPDLLRT
ncbi:MAG: phosphohistidine phosphatase SixA [Longimicrobiales bacterium]